MESKRRTHSHEAGFTLVEVMVAAVILTVAVMAVVSVLNWGVRLSQEAQARTVAMGLAMQQMEEIKAQYPKSPSDFDSGTLQNILAGQTTTQTIEAHVSKTFTISANLGKNPTSYQTPSQSYTFYDMLVTVRVSWQDYTLRSTRQVALTSELVGR